MNECLFIASLVLYFGLVLAFYRFWGRTGLFVWVALATVLANIEVVKTVELFGMTATLGNAGYASVFLATDILSEKYGKKSAHGAVGLGFAVMIVMVLLMQLAVAFQSAPGDIFGEALRSIFQFMPRVVIGSLAAYCVSQYCDVMLFWSIRKRFPGKRALWLRNNVATIVSQCLDTIVFGFIAFYGVFDNDAFISILLTTFGFKVLGAVLDTPFVYLACAVHPKEIDSGD